MVRLCVLSQPAQAVKHNEGRTAEIGLPEFYTFNQILHKHPTQAAAAASGTGSRGLPTSCG